MPQLWLRTELLTRLGPPVVKSHKGLSLVEEIMKLKS